MFKKTLKRTIMVGALMITLGVATQAPIQAEAETTEGTVTTNVLNVRSGGSMKYRVIGKINKGNKVNILSYSNGWYKIQIAGKTGWSSAKYISKNGLTSNSAETSSEAVTSTPVSSNRTITVKAYAYTGGGITATGTQARYGTLAVDPSVIPYGTRVYIKELGQTFTAEDCGGGIKGNKVDIYMNSTSQCYSWGARTITMEILN